MTFNFDRRALENMKKFDNDEGLKIFWTNVFIFSLLSIAEKKAKKENFFIAHAKPFTPEILARKSGKKESYYVKKSLKEKLKKIIKRKKRNKNKSNEETAKKMIPQSKDVINCGLFSFKKSEITETEKEIIKIFTEKSSNKKD